MLEMLRQSIEQLPEYHYIGRVKSIVGLMVEVEGLEHLLKIGSRCRFLSSGTLAEVVGIRAQSVVMMPFDGVEGIGYGDFVEMIAHDPFIVPHTSWLGRVIDPLGDPIDGKGSLLKGNQPYFIENPPLRAHKRMRVGERLDVGIRAINTFTPLCRGQRMGIFAGSGIGKSVLLSMLTKFAHADVIVIGLIGERGREVKEFLETNKEAMPRTVVVVATSDESAMRRRTAAHLTLTVAEFFRDQGKEVLCLIDSVTRFAMAQREIGLAAGEPPSNKGYTPSVFAALPKLLERAGPGEDQGNITGLFTILVDGDDHNEPIADAVRGILDGHIVLDRSLAERGHYPPIHILRSLSRTMPGCHTIEENVLIVRARQLLSVYEDMSDMIRLGAYRPGSNAEVDEAIRYIAPIHAFLKQSSDESSSFEEGFLRLKEILE